MHQTLTISVLTRHSAGCPQEKNPQWRRCKCRKQLYIYEDGKVRYKSAKTRSWEEAERAAQLERDLRDPVKLALREIARKEEERIAAEATKAANQIAVSDALDRWFATHKSPAAGTKSIHRTFVRKVGDWAKENDILYLADITPAMLDLWRGQWSPYAERKDDQIGATSQSAFLSRIKEFFSWAAGLNLIDRDPARGLLRIEPNKPNTMPLTRDQFQELLEIADKQDQTPNADGRKIGSELYALFLIMRWTGLRISDALMFPRRALQGNRIDLLTKKNKVDITCFIPDNVVDEVNARLAPRKGVHPDYFFWSGTCLVETMAITWTRRIRDLNKHLNFQDEKGNPMRFRSHMLRDTFAVELLLAGVSLEDVSRLLTHFNIATTEKYYSPWVKARKLQLEGKLLAAMLQMGATVSK